MKVVLLVLSLLVCNTHMAQDILTYKNQLNLVPEGIAIHPATGVIYVSSIAQRKIIKILPDDSSVDFILPGQDNFLEGLGMKIDAKKNLLWALSNIRKGKAFTSQIHAFDLTSGKTVHYFTMSDTIASLLNDLLLDSSDKLIITDTYQSSIFSYDPASKNLSLLIKDTSKLRWPNGIDYLDSENLIVATYGKGLVKINLVSKKTEPLNGYIDQGLAFGLDGLVVQGNYLFGVYNAGRGGYQTNAVIKYTLDNKLQTILHEEIIDKGNKAFADPTTAAMYRNKLYVIANSHLDQFNANKETTVGIESALTPLKLIVYGF